jgi:hypothetical protein
MQARKIRSDKTHTPCLNKKFLTSILPIEKMHKNKDGKYI